MIQIYTTLAELVADPEDFTVTNVVEDEWLALNAETLPTRIKVEIEGRSGITFNSVLVYLGQTNRTYILYDPPLLPHHAAYTFELTLVGADTVRSLTVQRWMNTVLVPDFRIGDGAVVVSTDSWDSIGVTFKVLALVQGGGGNALPEPSSSATVCSWRTASGGGPEYYCLITGAVWTRTRSAPGLFIFKKPQGVELVQGHVLRSLSVDTFASVDDGNSEHGPLRYYKSFDEGLNADVVVVNDFPHTIGMGSLETDDLMGYVLVMNLSTIVHNLFPYVPSTHVGLSMGSLPKGEVIYTQGNYPDELIVIYTEPADATSVTLNPMTLSQPPSDPPYHITTISIDTLHFIVYGTVYEPEPDPIQTITNNRITNNVLQGCVDTGISITNGANWIVLTNQVEGSSFAAFQLANLKQSQFRGNRLSGNPVGFILDNCIEVIIDGSFIENSGTYAE